MVGFQGERPADRLPGQPCARWRAQLQESSGAQEEQGSRLTFCTGCTGAPNFFS